LIFPYQPACLGESQLAARKPNACRADPHEHAARGCMLLFRAAETGTCDTRLHASANHELAARKPNACRAVSHDHAARGCMLLFHAARAGTCDTRLHASNSRRANPMHAVPTRMSMPRGAACFYLLRRGTPSLSMSHQPVCLATTSMLSAAQSAKFCPPQPSAPQPAQPSNEKRDPKVSFFVALCRRWS